jgi:N-formylglutamate deformylase
VRRVEQTLAGLGYRVRRNDPYAGGFITRHYGRPREGVHVLQIEVCRTLYMDEVRIERLPVFAGIQEDVTRLVAAIAAAAPEFLAG